jgi:sigma-B regulation protein RsbU (phosphoserine phosphatase)
MRIIKGWLKIGGLQQKIFNLVLIFILMIIGAYVAVGVWNQRNLVQVVQNAGDRQQESITKISEQTMEAVLDSSMKRITALQAYIADDLFGDVRSDVNTLQTIAEKLFENSDAIAMRPVYAPSADMEGIPSVQLIHEDGVNPEDSQMVGLMANMSEIMLSMFENSGKMSSVFVGTSDGNMILVNDRPSVFLSKDGTPLTLDIRHRPWYVQAAKAGKMIFTGVEFDAYTENPMVECAAPVYLNGGLVAIVAADIYLTEINDYVKSTATKESFVCVINEKGQMLFSPAESGFFKAESTADAPDLRNGENAGFASFLKKAEEASTEIVTVTADGKEYYVSGVPMPSTGWTVVSVVDKELVNQPAAVMLSQYEVINEDALGAYREGSEKSLRMIIILTVAVIVLASVGALVMAARIVKPVEAMTKRLNIMGDSNETFVMEDIYKTGDEIEILAESFANLSKRAADYIQQITTITAEKERIGTELALATRIQADMLPNIYPAFPERKEFDIYGSMDPAKEVGGDFYNFFLIDEDHLCMIMADVSGKGVPAALFMMASLIILSNNAMIGKNPAQILTDTNATICNNNREEMFVTVWLGILEISTGKLVAANAGHEYPALKQPNGQFELIKDKHGFVIGGMEGLKYQEYELMLEPGAKLFLYTDGVPEATNIETQQFGTDRMVKALNQDPDSSPKQILKNVRQSVDDFVKEAEQFDDLTMLCLEYNGKV